MCFYPYVQQPWNHTHERARTKEEKMENNKELDGSLI